MFKRFSIVARCLVGCIIRVKMWKTISKFGLQYCDLPTMLWNVTSMLRVLALDIDPKNDKPISLLGYVFLATLVLSYYYAYLISWAWFVFWRCRQTGDLLAAIVVFSLGLSSEIGMTKLIFMFIYRKSVKKIVSAYLACDADVESDSRFAVNIQNNLRKVKKRAIIFWNVIMWNGFIYVFKALVTPGRHFMTDVFVFYGLEPMTESPNYEIALTINIIGVFVTCYPAANITSFFLITVGYTESQMLALSQELRNLWADASKDSDTENPDTKRETVNKFVTKRLETILKIHTININLLQQIEEVFRGAIAVEFMLLVSAITAALLGGLENAWIQLPFAMMLVATDCLTGQRLTDASMVFEKAVYDSKWEYFDVGNRKIILLMLLNSQKGMKLSAGGVATLNFECLMAVYRMTYSAYTTLRSTMK